jgi:ankyrin repeat protein
MAQQTVAEKLVYAAGKGYIDDIAALLNQKADVNAKDQLGNTALSMYSPKKNYL